MKCLATVQHTGTWFVKDIIEQLTHCKISLLEEVSASVIVQPPKDDWLHFHVGPNDLSTWPNDTSEHLKFLGHPYAKAMATTFKTVIPLRDPMLSLITRQKRHPELVHTSIIDGFEFLSQLDDTNTFWFPIDQQLTLEERFCLIDSMCKFLDIESDSSVIAKIALEWEPKNSTPKDDEQLGSAYQKRDWEYLISRIPQSTKQLLTTPSIRDFLVERGYNLPWFKIMEM